MKSICHTFVVTVLVAAFAFPPDAAGQTMEAMMKTCADFNTMDAEAQMKSVKVMQIAMDEMARDEMTPEELRPDENSPQMKVSGEWASSEIKAIALECDEKPEIMVMDAITSN